MQAHILSLYTPWVKMSKHFFSECGYAAYKIKGKET